MRTIAGLQPSLAGEILITGQTLASFKPAELAKSLSLVLAEKAETGNLTAREVISLGRTPYTGWLGILNDTDKEKIDQAINHAGVAAFLNRHINQLSDGEKQKVMLARALAQDTPIILLDEPTAHLDLPSRIEMMRLLHRLARQTGKAILLSTHDLDLALQTADNLWLMRQNGELVSGGPEDLVLDGSFQSLFSNNDTFFDQNTGTFTIHNNPAYGQIHVSGDEKLVFWTKRALVREGFGTGPAENAFCSITAFAENALPVWKIRINGQTFQTSSINELIRQIRKGL